MSSQQKITSFFVKSSDKFPIQTNEDFDSDNTIIYDYKEDLKNWSKYLKKKSKKITTKENDKFVNCKKRRNNQIVDKINVEKVNSKKLTKRQKLNKIQNVTLKKSNSDDDVLFIDSSPSPIDTQLNKSNVSTFLNWTQQYKSNFDCHFNQKQIFKKWLTSWNEKYISKIGLYTSIYFF